MTETTEPLVKLGRGMADDLAVGHWSMGDAIQMIRGLCDRLEALSALPCKGGEAELREALDAYDTASAIARMTETREAVQKQAEARTRLFTLALNGSATPTTESDTGRGLRADVENEARRLYIAHVDGAGIHCNRFPSWGEMSDDSKKRWRAQALAALSDTPRGREISEVETHRADAVAPASKDGA